MQLKLQNMLKMLVSAALISASAPVQAVEVQIQQDINFRQMRNGHRVLGILKAGSIIDVAISDDQRGNHLDPNHPGFEAFDLRKTLQNMMSHPEAGQISYKNINGQNTPLFKVSIVRKAVGSSYDAATGSTTMIALDYLASRGKALTSDAMPTSAQPRLELQTTEDTSTYSTEGDNTDSSYTTEAQAVTTDCPDGSCNVQSGALSQSAMDQLAQLGSVAARPDDSTSEDGSYEMEPSTPSTAGLQGFPAIGSCNRFIGRDGSYGDYGRMAIANLRQHPAFASHNTPFTSICRNYIDFSDEQKEQFQVWVLASISAQEAGGCQAGIPNYQGINGTAAGLLQMEESTRLRASRPHPYCDGGSRVMYNASNNISCGVAIMDRGLVGPNLSLYDPRSSNNYWAVLIHPGKTHDLINAYQACGNSVTHYAANGGRSYARSRYARRLRKHRG